MSKIFYLIFFRSNQKIQVAISGKAFEMLLEARNKDKDINEYKVLDVLSKIIYLGRVYARMSPKQKGMLIKELQEETGELIGMCGDGSNDCQALKLADVGMSFSEAEASVAAPFASKIHNISSTVDLLRLGRYSLDVSYRLVKFLTVHTLMEFLTTFLLFLATYSISDAQFARFDILWLFPVGVILCSIAPKQELPPYYPPDSLFNLEILSGIIGQILIAMAGTMGILFCLKSQDFYIAKAKQSKLGISN